MGDGEKHSAFQNMSVGCHIGGRSSLSLGHTLNPSAQLTYNNLLLYNWLPQLLTEKKRGGNNSVGRTTQMPRCDTDAGLSRQRGKVFFSPSRLSVQSDSHTATGCKRIHRHLCTKCVIVRVQVSECVCVCVHKWECVHACVCMRRMQPYVRAWERQIEKSSVKIPKPLSKIRNCPFSNVFAHYLTFPATLYHSCGWGSHTLSYRLKTQNLQQLCPSQQMEPVHSQYPNVEPQARGERWKFRMFRSLKSQALN